MHSGLAKRHCAPSSVFALWSSWYVIAFIVLLAPWAACDSPTSEGIDRDAGEVVIGPDGEVIRPGDDTVLLGGYVPSEPCGELGNTCSNGKPCGPGMTCEGGVCLPDPRYQQVESCRLNSCPQDAAICLFGVCITPEELACVCLDRVGRTRAYQCAALRENPSDECLAETALCDGRPDGCCGGLKCMQGTGADGKQLVGICMEPCASDDACTSNCCADSDQISEPFCGESIETCLNECKRLDEECDAERNPCCMGLVCAKSAQDIGLNGCQLPCTKHSECATGCCILFTSQDGTTQDNGICGPADRCQTP
jgi:hypothetical protein